MYKKMIVTLLVVALLVSVVHSSAFATVLNEDVSISTPINSNFEAGTEAQAVDTQLTSAGSGAALSDDAKEGDFSLKVTAGIETPNPYAQYTLVSTSQFSIVEYSSIKIWVKPGIGASWISFYTNNVLIASDKDGGGRFEVGSDLASGKWTQLTLDLLKTDSSITTGDDLVVRSNDNSVWSFDEVKAQGTVSTSIDLSMMVNDSTTLNDGKVQFSKTSDGTVYVSTPTTLVSNRNPGLEKVFSTQKDFLGGTCVNSSICRDGYITSSMSDTDLCTGGTAISGGYYSEYGQNRYPSYAFDGSTSTYWSSSQQGAATVNNAYIGYDFGADTTINGISLLTSIYSTVTSAYVQYYNSSGIWVTVKTIPIANSGSIQYIWLDSSISASKWRLLAASYSSTANQWAVSELRFISTAWLWSYTSAAIDISSTSTISYGNISCDIAEGTDLDIETSLSLDGGATWQDWTVPNAGGTINGIDTTNLQNARIMYRLSGSKIDGAADPMVYSVKLQLQTDELVSDSLTGKLQGISIDSSVVDINGNAKAIYDGGRPLTLQDKAFYAISGNGKLMFYINSGSLYSLEISSGVSTLLSNSISPIAAVTSIKASYDGSILVILGLSSSNDRYLVKYDANSTTGLTILGSCSAEPAYQYNFIVYDIQDTGGILYYLYTYKTSTSSYSGTLYYYSTSNIKTQWDTSTTSLNSITVADLSTDYFSGNASSILYKFSRNIYSGSGATVIHSNKAGDTLYFITGTTLYTYNVKSSALRHLLTGVSSFALIKDEELIIRNSDNKYFIYNPISGTQTDIVLPYLNAASTTCFIDDAGTKIIYQATDGIRVKYLITGENVNKYLLSFDGKNTWYSYGSGTWQMVSNKKTPDDITFKEYGMTAEQVNALTANDYAPLYADGNEIYAVDVAVYFQSVSPNYSPSISSIKIITDANSYDDPNNSTSNPLYAAKSVDFSGLNWREVNKIFPVEICNKASDYVYFFYADGKYAYYDGSAWHTETGTEIADLIADVDTNWIDIKLIGMRAEEVRKIPASTLTTQFAGKDFAVVYCMKVPDISTVGYYSLITADYTEDLYASANLILNIKYTDGTTEQIAGMTSAQIEDFMDWLLGFSRRSPTYYHITVGNIHYHINYYSVSKATVTES